MLVGDEADLTFSSTGPGDYWYSNLSGDLKPEIAIGRISATVEDEVDHVVSKIISYELDPPKSNWVEKAVLVAHKQGAPGKYQGCKEEIRTYVNYNPTPVFSTLYGASSSVGGDEATNADVTNSINAGKGIVNYRGHGGSTCWSNWNIYGQNYTTSDARALNNGEKRPIIFSIACSNSRLDASSECLAKAFSKTEGGASAFLGASRSSYTEANYTYDKELFKALFDYQIYSIGDLSNIAASKIIDEHGSYGAYNAKIYLWLGDPAMEAYTDLLNDFNSDNITITDNGSSITVSTGVSGCDICASSGNNGATFWQVQNNVSRYTFNTSVRPLYITVTKHNYIPYTAVTGGTFTSNEYWFGNLYVLGSVVMDGNSTLSILPGTTIKFSSGTELKINGTLIAQGSSSAPIHFTSAGSSNWSGIKFENSSSGTLKYCEIDHATYGVYVKESKPTVENCEINILYLRFLFL